jgi:hypothetical protein
MTQPVLLRQLLLRRYPVEASGFHLIDQETERGWEPGEDISTLSPSLVRFEKNAGTANRAVRQRLQEVSLNTFREETSLRRHTILRAEGRASTPYVSKRYQDCSSNDFKSWRTRHEIMIARFDVFPNV